MDLFASWSVIRLSLKGSRAQRPFFVKWYFKRKVEQVAVLAWLSTYRDPVQTPRFQVIDQLSMLMLFPIEVSVSGFNVWVHTLKHPMSSV